MIQTCTTLDAYQLVHAGILAFAHAEQNGIRIDVDYCNRKKQQLTHKINAMEEEFKETNFWKHWEHIYGKKANVGSDHQLAHILYDIKKITPSNTTKKGRGSTDEETLRQLDMPELTLRIERDKLLKVRDTYLDAFVREAVDGYIHPFFNLHLARTHRSSSDHPNWQNIPIRDEESMTICRRAIFPRPGHRLVEIDYSGMEVKSNACLNKDPELVRYVSDPSTDMHRDMAQVIFKIKQINKNLVGHEVLRQAAKNGFVFPEFYGDFYGNCARNIAHSWGQLPITKHWKPGQGIPLNNGTLSDHLIAIGLDTIEKFTDHLKKVEDDFWKRFRVYKRWKERWWRDYQEKGYFDMPTGFRCSGVMKEKEVCNYPGQGTGFHNLLWSFVQVDNALREGGFDSRLAGQIHDSMVIDMHPDEMEDILRIVLKITCKDLLKHWAWIIVPMDVKIEACEIDQPWSEKKKYELKEAA